jgi:hypothetical protein
MAKNDEWSIQPFAEILDSHEADYRSSSGTAAKKSLVKDIAREIQVDGKERGIGIAYGETLNQVRSCILLELS